MFENRHLLIATKHKKETILGPLFDKGLGVKSFVSNGFDTDIFGTFTGEVKRKGGPVIAARTKCLEAMKIYGCNLCVASEGSFGSHPYIPYLFADEEVVIFIDKKNDLEIFERIIDLKTNFMKEEIKTWEELVVIGKRKNFPSHGLILKSKKKDSNHIFKGINSWENLEVSYEALKKQGKTILVETDMRAMYNPTRMKIIGKTAQKLIEKIKSCCPQCVTPGFGAVAATAGLPCSFCGTATRSTLSHTYECKKCFYKTEKEFPDGKKSEDPMYCDRCNP